MESIITIVGFLGAGKTTLLKHLVESAVKNQWHPYVILNDYIDTDLDAQHLRITRHIGPRVLSTCTICPTLHASSAFVT